MISMATLTLKKYELIFGAMANFNTQFLFWQLHTPRSQHCLTLARCSDVRSYLYKHSVYSTSYPGSCVAVSGDKTLGTRLVFILRIFCAIFTGIRKEHVQTFFINGDFGTETRLVCFLVGQYLFPTTKLTCFYVLSLLKSLNNTIIQS